jgi:hypothetical protein
MVPAQRDHGLFEWMERRKTKEESSRLLKKDNCGVCGEWKGERKTNMEGFDVLARWASLVRATRAGISRCAFFCPRP